MPLHPPAASALTSPVYFGLHLNASRVFTPELLRAHLQTVRQTLQCDFIVIPTASDSSLATSKASAAVNSQNTVRKSAEAARDSHALGSTTSTDASGGHATDTSTPVIDTSAHPFPVPNSSSAGESQDDCASPAATPAATAESVVLVESPRFATGRATIPAQHLADAAVDYSSFCRNFLSPPQKREKGARRDGVNPPESEEPSISRTGKPSFNALDGGLAALPPTYAFAPSTESDLALDSQTWNSAVVCEISPWISPDLGVLPEGRILSTTVPRAFRLKDAASNGSSVSAAATASSCAAGRCPAANPSASFSHSLEGSHSAVAATHADHESTASVAAEEKALTRSTRRAPTASAAVRTQTALIQSTEETEGSEQKAQYNKRSRTAELGPLARKEAAGGESIQVARRGEDEQGQPRAHGEQLQHPEVPSWIESGASDKSSEAMELKKRSSECSAAPSEELPAAAAGLLSSTRASALSCDAAATTSEASTASASALAGARRGKQLAAERDEQVQLERGLLRHWSFHESAWQREMQWATHVGAFAVITPPPAPDLIPVEYSRLLRAALNQLQPPNIWMKLPLMYTVSSSRGSKSSARESLLSSRSHNRSCTSSQSSSQSSSASSPSSSSGEGTEREDACEKDSSGRQSAGGARGHCCFRKPSRRRRRHQAGRQQDPWQLWRYIRSMVGPHPSLGLCLEITPDLPDSDSELERWFAEPLRAVVLSPSLFTSSSTSCSSGSFRSVSENNDLRGTCNYSRRFRGNGGTGSRPVAAGKAAGRKSVAAGESGVCMSPRHRRFLMKCAQHRVKIIFRSEENEEDGYELEMHRQPMPSSETTAARGGAPAGTQGRAAALDIAGAAVEEGRKALEKSQMPTRNSDVASCEDVQRQEQVAIFAADDFPLLSGAGYAASTKRSSQSPAAAAAAGAALKKRADTACHGRGAAAQKGAELVKSSAVPLEEMQPYISYVAQQLLQLPTLKQTELFSAPYRDVLQSPMQPLADNLSAGNYEVFEKDPVKYLRYKEATLLRLREIWPSASIDQQHQQRNDFEAGKQTKSDAGPYQGQTKQPQGQQQQQQHKEQTDRRDDVGAVAAAAAPTSDTNYARPAGVDPETQKRRKKNRGRRRARHSRSAYYWDYGSEEEEEEDDGTAATSFLHASSSSCTAASPASGFTSYSGGCPPPPPPTSSPCLSSSNSSSMHASDWCLKGADCTLHAAAGPRLVLTIVGAGRGPLVQAALEALREASIPLCRARVFAVEKNWNAVITLRSRVRSDACVGWRAVEVVEADMREAGDCVAERADILISELLGSFGDNELSAECLDGAQMRLLKKGGVSIPSAYVSSLEPVSTHTLWQAIDSYNDPKQFECAYVVNMFAKYFPSKEGPKECFHYRHPHFLLPFGDDVESSSSSSSGGGDRSRRWGSESTSSDSESDIEKAEDGSRKKNRSSRKETSSNSSSQSGRGIRRRKDEARGQDGRKEEGYPRATDIPGETCKRHEVYAGATNPETLHVKGTAGSAAEGSGRAAADGRSPKQQDAGVHLSPVACTAMQGCTQNKESGVAGEKRGSGTSTKASASSRQPACARKKNKKKSSYKERCGYTAAELTILRHRRTRLSWRMRTDAVVHGLAGYFHCCLYKSVYISIDPRSFSEGMFSWFPLFLPFRQPVYVRRNEKLEVYIARDGDEHKVWYEWAVLQPTLSEIYNHMGKHSYIGK